MCRIACLITQFFDHLMIHRDYTILSEFTIMLLEDSGWYKANYTALDEINQHPLLWEKVCQAHFAFCYLQMFRHCTFI